MLHLDDVQLYDLSEAGRLLFRDPARLQREARLRLVPAARVEDALGLPAPWVDAEAGASAADPVSLRTYWLARLAPAAPDARRPRRARERLPAGGLLEPAEAARRLFATAASLARLDADGSVPALRVDDRVVYDEELVARVAREDEGPAERAAADARRAEVRAWARFEYGDVEPPPPPPSFRPAVPAPAPAAAPSAAPKAFEIPDDLGLDDIGTLDAPSGSTLLDVDGFETVDED